MTNIEIKTRNIMNSLNNSERKVANYLLNNFETIFSVPISRLAEESGVSQVTWIRFCKAIGFDGLKDLKRSLFLELNNSPTDSDQEPDFSDIKKQSTLKEMGTTICSTTVKAVKDTMTLVDYSVIKDVVYLLSTASCIKLFGVGASGIVCDDFYRKLLRINKNVVFNSDLHTQLTYGANCCASEVAVIFSYSGATKEMLEILNLAKKAGCPTVAITKYTKSPLVSKSDFSIYLSAPEINYRSGAMSSRIAQLTIVDLLFSCLAKRDYKNVEKYLEESTQVCRSHRV